MGEGVKPAWWPGAPLQTGAVKGRLVTPPPRVAAVLRVGRGRERVREPPPPSSCPRGGAAVRDRINETCRMTKRRLEGGGSWAQPPFSPLAPIPPPPPCPLCWPPCNPPPISFAHGTETMSRARAAARPWPRPTTRAPQPAPPPSPLSPAAAPRPYVAAVVVRPGCPGFGPSPTIGEGRPPPPVSLPRSIGWTQRSSACATSSPGQRPHASRPTTSAWTAPCGCAVQGPSNPGFGTKGATVGQALH